jgi:nucleoside-triphosphatase
MPLNFFITGLPKAGKTTLLRTIIKSLRAGGLYVGGFISPDEKHSGRRTGFMVQDIETGKTDVLALMNSDGPKVSKYHVDIGSFESVAMISLSDFQKYDVVVIDEIGPMETKSTVFMDALDDLLDSGTPLVASLHEDMADRYAPLGTVFEIDETNREQVSKDILAAVARIPKKAQREAQKHQEKMKKERESENRPRKQANAKTAASRAEPKKKAVAGKANARKKGKAARRQSKTKAAKSRNREEPGNLESPKRGVVRQIRELLGF